MESLSFDGIIYTMGYGTLNKYHAIYMKLKPWNVQIMDCLQKAPQIAIVFRHTVVTQKFLGHVQWYNPGLSSTMVLSFDTPSLTL